MADVRDLRIVIIGAGTLPSTPGPVSSQAMC
jgi:hypothetical protein